jgi:hypothetical protein
MLHAIFYNMKDRELRRALENSGLIASVGFRFVSARFDAKWNQAQMQILHERINQLNDKLNSLAEHLGYTPDERTMKTYWKMSAMKNCGSSMPKTGHT